MYTCVYMYSCMDMYIYFYKNFHCCIYIYIYIFPIRFPMPNLCCLALGSRKEDFFQINAEGTEFMCCKQEGAIHTLNGGPLKSVDKFPYLGSSVSSIENDVVCP